MTQFDVLATPDHGAETPFLVVLQHDSVSYGDMVVVAPCVPSHIGPRGRSLTPAISIEGETYLVVVPEMTAIPRAAMSRRVVANIAADRDAFTAAIDLLFTGY